MSDLRNSDMLKRYTAWVLVAVAVTGCTTIRETQPTQTAREQLMLSTAADQASQAITTNVPPGSAVFIDDTYFAADPEYRTGYALARIRAALLSDGYRLVDTAGEADTIAEVSTGALSIDEADTLFGIPSIPVPIPLTGTVRTPELAIYKKKSRTGVAKFLLAFYDAETGGLQDIVGPVYGFSHDDRSSVLGIGWKDQNILPPETLPRYRNRPAPTGASTR